MREFGERTQILKDLEAAWLHGKKFSLVSLEPDYEVQETTSDVEMAIDFQEETQVTDIQPKPAGETSSSLPTPLFQIQSMKLPPIMRKRGCLIGNERTTIGLPCKRQRKVSSTNPIS
uniref:Uncharacterized protein n=1 Tax=Amphimedon queenslandica TaxID=400682 RepID=A0A1X7TR25_AMPQE